MVVLLTMENVDLSVPTNPMLCDWMIASISGAFLFKGSTTTTITI
jgi:hypothetical protein